ncbi:hypothetical protein GN244_ATG14646 [Phytophthora infestans]|uniref:Uncharacterized protein n=1 Tax=Phytophthora infestans TaxID=4787 RepID=A0A833RU21_PHYIN|nr:hypothetical protein GN244_ATG14646 [Phytophthora infestans]
MSSEGVSSVDSEPRHRTNDSIGGCLEAGERADEWSAVTDRVLVGVVTANKTGTCGVRSEWLRVQEAIAWWSNRGINSTKIDDDTRNEWVTQKLRIYVGLRRNPTKWQDESASGIGDAWRNADPFVVSRSDKLGADEDSTHDNEANNTADDGDGGLGLGDGYRDVSTTTAGHGESGSDS